MAKPTSYSFDKLRVWERIHGLHVFAGWSMHVFAKDGLYVVLTKAAGEVLLDAFATSPDQPRDSNPDTSTLELVSQCRPGTDISKAVKRMERLFDAHGGPESVAIILDMERASARAPIERIVLDFRKGRRKSLVSVAHSKEDPASGQIESRNASPKDFPALLKKANVHPNLLAFADWLLAL